VYVPLAVRSHAIWRELEEETGEALLLTCGTLIIGPAEGGATLHGRDDFVGRSAAAARAFDIDHEVLGAPEIMRRTPQFVLRGDERGYYEPGGGLLYPERCIAAQLQLAERMGAIVVRNEQVLRIDDGAASVRIETDKGAYEADQAVLAAGAWTWDLIDRPAPGLALQPQQLHWFACEDPDDYQADRFPVFIWNHGPDPDHSFYGFPISPGAPTKAVKVAMEATHAIPTMSDFDRQIPPAASQALFQRHVRGRLRGVEPLSVKSAACIYTTTPDSDFIIGRPEGCERIVLASACSGHGFKHSAAVGELLAEAVQPGGDARVPAVFARSRFRISGS
jgi:sarcosine oxidase